MSAIKHGIQDLLEYNPKYSVLICCKCQYAIQKNALESHLLRHKIYRSERQCLLASVSHLPLLEPDHVLPPAADSPPIEGIPVLTGYRCTLPDCQHLTVSEKRMQRHWSDAHGSGKIIPKLSTSAVAVSLQTFFRGTKVRYFEVTPPTSSFIINHEDSAGKDVPINYHDESQNEQRVDDLQIAKKITPLAPSMSQSRMTDGLGSEMDMLTYFHHFITTTSLTLPSMRHVNIADTYWQVDVIARALGHRWLMYGLLAIAASHLSCLTDDDASRKTHRQKAAQFLYDFFPGLESEVDASKVGTSEAGDTLLKMGEQVRCLLTCAKQALPGACPWETEPLAISSEFQSLMSSIRGCIVISNNDLQTPPEVLSDGQRTSQNSGLPTAISNALRTLPFRLAECTSRPDDPQDVVTSMTAIAVLFECCELSFGRENMGVSWQSMVNWLLKMSHHFEQMVVRSDPVALVVVAYWAALLVTRAQLLGCWYLTGVADTILRQISERLLVDKQPALALVEHLLGESGSSHMTEYVAP